ncbi:MAG: CDP-alcohol phosphatidyltransferase family protein [Bryobacteraceae bacterium]
MRHVPNILSAARLIAAPYVFVLLWTHEWNAALIWMAIIGATDGFDGYLARRFDATSKLGAILDPVADKVLLSGSFLTLALNHTIPTWLAGLVLGRDAAILLVAVIVMLLTTTRREFPPSLAGKLSTLMQILYILSLVGHEAGYFPEILPFVLAHAVLVVTGWSCVDYAIKGWAMRHA